MSNRMGKYLFWGSIALGVLLFAAAVIYVISTLPPRTFSILTGREGGAYYQVAQAYQEVAAEKGFTLELIPTAGSVETLDRLEQGDAGIGFAQGGTARDRDASQLNTMASIFYEPLWIFYRREINPDEPPETLQALEGLRINIGEPRSGTQMLARLLLEESGIDESNTTFSELTTGEAAQALLAGEVDAIMFVSAVGVQTVSELITHEAIGGMHMALADAYATRHDFLSVLELPRGTIDPAIIRPERDTQLVSTVANLVVRTDFHPDLLRLMTIAIVRTHGDGGIFEEHSEFPNFEYADLPVSPREIAYIESLKSGESWLDNYLPFWAAALIDRYVFFLLPIALLLLPVASRLPLVINFFARRRVNRWYGQVRKIEMQVDKMEIDQIEKARARLERLDNYVVRELDVGATYMPSVYDLRQHIGYVMTKLQRRKATLTGEPTPEAGPVRASAAYEREALAPIGRNEEGRRGVSYQ